MTVKYKIEDVLSVLARGHSFLKHVKGNGAEPCSIVNEFHDPALGTIPKIDGKEVDIEAPDDLEKLLKTVVKSSRLKGHLVPGNGLFLYDPDSNVFIAINGSDEDMGTAYRLNNYQNTYNQILKTNRQSGTIKTGTGQNGIRPLINHFMNDINKGKNLRAARRLKSLMAKYGIKPHITRQRQHTAKPAFSNAHDHASSAPAITPVQLETPIDTDIKTNQSRILQPA